VEGLLRFTDLPEDWWEVDAQAGCVIGERTGHSIRIGDVLPVAIARIDLSARQLDLGLAEPLPATQRRSPGPSGESRRKPARRFNQDKRPGRDSRRGKPHKGKSGKGRAPRGRRSR
jgi:ribonuclease R